MTTRGLVISFAIALFGACTPATSGGGPFQAEGGAPPDTDDVLKHSDRVVPLDEGDASEAVDATSDVAQGRDVDPTCVPTPENTNVTCTDGVDNDCDGRIDCIDPGCSGNPAVTLCRPPPAADCTRCTANEQCAGGLCFGFMGSPQNWCSRACRTNADCTDPRLPNCNNSICGFNGLIAACSADGAAIVQSNTCGSGEVRTACTGAMRCSVVGGVPTCGAPACVPVAENSVGACGDRADNDCDGLVDCADPDCSGNPAVTACRPPPAADCTRCTANDQCAGGLCFGFMGSPQNWCSRACRTNADCTDPRLPNCNNNICAFGAFAAVCSADGAAVVQGNACGSGETRTACTGTMRCSVVGGTAACRAPTPTGLPLCSACMVDADCADGVCALVAGSRFCTRRCTTTSNCGGVFPGDRYFVGCSSMGYCFPGFRDYVCSTDRRSLESLDTCGLRQPVRACTASESCQIITRISANSACYDRCEAPSRCTSSGGMTTCCRYTWNTSTNRCCGYCYDSGSRWDSCL